MFTITQIQIQKDTKRYKKIQKDTNTDHLLI